MSWSKMIIPNPLFDVNGDPYSGAVLKAYLPGGTTSTSIAIDSAGASPQTSITYNAEGKLEVSGNEIEAYIDRKHKYGIFANATDAAANTPFYMGPFDNVTPVSGIESVKYYATQAAAVASLTLQDGDALSLAEHSTGKGGGGIWDVVLSSTVTEDTYFIVQCTGVGTLSMVLRTDGEVTLSQIGAVDDVDSEGALQAGFTWSKANTKWIYGETGKVYQYGSLLTLANDVLFDGRNCSFRKNFAGIGMQLSGGGTPNTIINFTNEGWGAGLADNGVATSDHGFYVINNVVRLQNVKSLRHKGNGFEVESASPNMNGSEWGMGGKVQSTNNDGDGFNFSGTNNNASIWTKMWLEATANQGLGIRCSDDWVGRQWQGFLYLEDNGNAGGLAATVAGTDDTSTAAAFLTDSTASWAVDSLTGLTITNSTDGSTATITSNTANTILGTLSGGTNDNWDSGDAYSVALGTTANYIGRIRYSELMIYAEENAAGLTKDIIFGTATDGNTLISTRLNRWGVHGLDNRLYRGTKEQSWNPTNRYRNVRGINVDTSDEYIEDYFQGSSGAGELTRIRHYGDGRYEVRNRKTSNGKTHAFDLQHPQQKYTVWNSTAGDLATLVHRGSRGTEDTPAQAEVNDVPSTTYIQAMNSSGAWKNIARSFFTVTGLGGGNPGGKWTMQIMPVSSSTLADAIQCDADNTAGNTRFFLYDVDDSSLKRVTVGVADSGGVGYKLLRITN